MEDDFDFCTIGFFSTPPSTTFFPFRFVLVVAELEVDDDDDEALPIACAREKDCAGASMRRVGGV